MLLFRLPRLPRGPRRSVPVPFDSVAGDGVLDRIDLAATDDVEAQAQGAGNSPGLRLIRARRHGDEHGEASAQTRCGLSLQRGIFPLSAPTVPEVGETLARVWDAM